MKKITLLIISSLILFTCGDGLPASWEDSDENPSWVFVANEGNFGSSNGTISMIDHNGNVFETDPIGDVVQSLEVYGNKLIVLVNNSHMIKVYDITEEGLSMPGSTLNLVPSYTKCRSMQGDTFFTSIHTPHRHGKKCAYENSSIRMEL